MQVIKINSHRYIRFEEIVVNHPSVAKGVRNGRGFILKHDLSNNDYIYARQSNGYWIESDGSSDRVDKVFLRKSYVDSLQLDEKQEYEDAPPIIDLEENEKFHDNEGNIYEVETRGTRHVDNIYFKVKDVAEAFDMPKLHDHILDKTGGYIELSHHIYFRCKSLKSRGKNNQISKPKLFLTYEGLLRALFVSKKGKTTPFIKWATETLFTAHLGTPEQKSKLASNILGVSVKSLREVFNTNTHGLPTIYLFTLGDVKDLRKSMKIGKEYDDSYIVAKFGFTKDLARRSKEHNATYSKLRGCDLRLKFHSYIDPQFLSEAEKAIKDYMNSSNMEFEFGDEEELVIFSKKKLKAIERLYTMIGSQYRGHYAELIEQINKLKHQLELQQERHEKEMLQKDNELMKKELEMLRANND